MDLPVFSLESLVAPICPRLGADGERLFVVDLELWRVGGRSHRVDSRARLAALRRLVERGTTVDRDALLPSRLSIQFVSRSSESQPDIVVGRIAELMADDAMLKGMVVVVDVRAVACEPPFMTDEVARAVERVLPASALSERRPTSAVG